MFPNHVASFASARLLAHPFSFRGRIIEGEASHRKLQGVAMRSRLIALTLSLACSFLGSPARQAAAQDPADSSVADAARRAQEQKKSASKPTKVITNETLPTAPPQGSRSLAGTQPAPSPDAAPQPAISTEAAPATPEAASDAPQASAAADKVDASTATTDKEASAEQPAGAAGADKAPSNPEVTLLKQQIAEQQKEVELLMRLHALDEESFLSNPDHAKDLQGKARLDAQQEEIHAKVAAVARLKEKLASIAPGESAKVRKP